MTAHEVKVTQADRDAAAAYYYSAGGSPSIAKAIRAGEKDTWFRVQAFARHRATATAPLEARIAALEGALGEAREALERIEYRSTNHGGWFDQPGMQFHEYCALGEIASTTLASLRAMLADDGEK
jgi:hypothetical protein